MKKSNEERIRQATAQLRRQLASNDARITGRSKSNTEAVRQATACLRRQRASKNPQITGRPTPPSAEQLLLVAEQQALAGDLHCAKGDVSAWLQAVLDQLLYVEACGEPLHLARVLGDVLELPEQTYELVSALVFEAQFAGSPDPERTKLRRRLQRLADQLDGVADDRRS